MRKISDFLSKPLISLANASFEGTIIGVLCDKRLRNIEFLVILVENEVLDEQKYVAIRYVKNTTENSATVSNNLCIKSAEEVDTERFTENPINSSVYDSDGKLIGHLCDLLFSDTTKQICQIDVEGKLLEANTVASTSHDIVIINSNPEKRPYKVPPRKVKKPKEDIKVTLLDEKPNFCNAHQNNVPLESETLAPPPTDIEVAIQDTRSSEPIIENSIDVSTEELNDNVNEVLNEELTLDASDINQPVVEDLHFCNADTAFEDYCESSFDAPETPKSAVEDSPEALTKPNSNLSKTLPRQSLIAEELACELVNKENIATPEALNSENEVTVSVISEVKFQELISDLKDKGFDEKMPIRLVSDYRFLLGRTVTNNIYNLRKELVVEKNTTVTVPVVEHALRTGKLIELILNSRPV